MNFAVNICHFRVILGLSDLVYRKDGKPSQIGAKNRSNHIT